MSTQQKKRFFAEGACPSVRRGSASGRDVRYDMRASDFVISSNGNDILFPAPWIIRDGSGMRTDKTELTKYFHELCGIFGEQIKEFEALKRQANKAEQKRLQTLLALTLEAQELLYDDEDA